MPAAITNRDEIVQTILERVAEGEYIADICAEPGMPNPKTVWKWIDGDEELTRQRLRARARSAAVEERRVSEIAAKLEAGEMAPEVARVAIHARTWLAKVRDPKSYGDKLDVEHKGRITVVPVLNVTIAGPAPRIIEGEADTDGA